MHRNINYKFLVYTIQTPFQVYNDFQPSNLTMNIDRCSGVPSEPSVEELKYCYSPGWDVCPFNSLES